MGNPQKGSTAPSAGLGVKELTVRGVVIGGIITLVFTAANIYLGLKVGLTFATSIPAAVISMAILRHFQGHTIQENNIVQTIASAAGCLSAIIFVLPGLVIVGHWHGFPYWETVALCALGGILGVTYSIPLRRALVIGSDLPYPEGVAAAEVLKVGEEADGAEEGKRGLKLISWGAASSAAFSLLASLKVAAGSVAAAFRVGPGASMVSTSLSLALIGVGHLVGLSVGIAMLVGMLVSYGVLLPTFSAGKVDGAADLLSAVSPIFGSDVRFVGAGAIAVAAIWTLIRVIGPIVKGIRDSLAASRKHSVEGDLPLTERDIPFKTVVLITLGSMLPIAALLYAFLGDTAMAQHAFGLVAISIIYVLLVGLAVASVCGYMAGLIGASNSPISGVGILVAITTALLIKAVFGDAGEPSTLVAYTLFTAGVVFGIGTISNDNLQDLKTGQLVGATPWKQQVALIIGVVFGALVIPPVLDLMSNAFGFVGAPGAGENALAAPQASLITSLILGVFGGSINWGLLGLGVAIGTVAIVIDEVLKKTTTKYSLPPIAVGMGMYLPIALTIMIPIGAALGRLYDRWAAKQADPERSKRMGTLMATGLIVGESLWGVVYAGIVGAAGVDEPLAIAPAGFEGIATLIGLALFIAIVGFMYRYARRKSQE
ncbi:oligopeptide transporter, OPT family [Eggerthellaceae bacterium zg-997]|nr:oligopeptide transporter, OPT family [Eggerthellaceae bacterium zg-997]